jgi:hypothetical protein
MVKFGVKVVLGTCMVLEYKVSICACACECSWALFLFLGLYYINFGTTCSQRVPQPLGGKL